MLVGVYPLWVLIVLGLWGSFSIVVSVCIIVALFYCILGLLLVGTSCACGEVDGYLATVQSTTVPYCKCCTVELQVALRWGIAWFRFCSVLRVCCGMQQGVVGPRCSGTCVVLC